MGLDNPIHILLLLLIVLMVFGAKRLPDIGRSLGEGMRGFKDSLTGDTQPERVLPDVGTPPIVAVASQPAEPSAGPDLRA